MLVGFTSRAIGITRDGEQICWLTFETIKKKYLTSLENYILNKNSITKQFCK